MTQQTEVELYLERARNALQQARDNLNLDYYDVTTSRAYYAMFYAASALLASKGISRSKHSGVHLAFSQYFIKPGLIEIEYAKMLGHAFDSRLDSDYDMMFSAERTLAEDVLHDAQHFVDRAERYLRQVGVL
jgi:uncharacterized protein (UPF0332 family)